MWNIYELVELINKKSEKYRQNVLTEIVLLAQHDTNSQPHQIINCAIESVNNTPFLESKISDLEKEFYNHNMYMQSDYLVEIVLLAQHETNSQPHEIIDKAMEFAENALPPSHEIPIVSKEHSVS